MKIIGKLEGQGIIDVRVVTQPGEQHHGLGLVRAAPVQHLHPDARFDLDERHVVGCGITAGGRLSCRLVSGLCPDGRVVQAGLAPATRAACEQERHGDGRVTKTFKTPCLRHGGVS
jgi:hypothetical protein